MQSAIAAESTTIDDLISWIRAEVSIAAAAGINWRLVINGSGLDDVSMISERHSRLRKRKPADKKPT